MKNYLLILLFAFFLIPFYANAQTTDNPTMLVVYENEISPSMVSAYEAVAIKEAAILKKLNYPRSYFVYQTEDYHYWWVIQIKDLNDFEEFNQEFREYAIRMAEEEGFVFGKEFIGKTNFVKPMIFQWLPDISYTPEGSAPQLDQPQYFAWGMCYVKVGFELEFLANQRKWVELTKEKQLGMGWNFYTGVIGTENPFYLWGETYESPVDMATKRAKGFDQVPEENEKLWNEALQYMRKFEYKKGWYRPDLSYILEN